MHTGKIKKIIKSKGFGFIHDVDGRDIFFHQGSLLDIQLTDLEEGQRVEFEVKKTPKGPIALNVIIVKSDEF